MFRKLLRLVVSARCNHGPSVHCHTYLLPAQLPVFESIVYLCGRLFQICRIVFIYFAGIVQTQAFRQVIGCPGHKPRSVTARCPPSSVITHAHYHHDISVSPVADYSAAKTEAVHGYELQPAAWHQRFKIAFIKVLIYLIHLIRASFVIISIVCQEARKIGLVIKVLEQIAEEHCSSLPRALDKTNLIEHFNIRTGLQDYAVFVPCQRICHGIYIIQIKRSGATPETTHKVNEPVAGKRRKPALHFRSQLRGYSTISDHIEESILTRTESVLRRHRIARHHIGQPGQFKQIITLQVDRRHCLARKQQCRQQ